MNVCKRIKDKNMKKTKEEAEITKESILQAALEVFSKNGYAASRMIDIAKEAGVTRGAIYWHFENKFDVLLSLVQDFKTNFNIELMSLIRQDSNPEKILHDVMIYIFGTTKNEEEFIKLEQLSTIMRELPDNSEKIIDELKKQRDEILNEIRSIIDKLNLPSSNRSAESRDLLTRIYLGYIKGILMTWSEDKWFGENNFKPWENAEMLATFFLNAFYINNPSEGKEIYEY